MLHWDLLSGTLPGILLAAGFVAALVLLVAPTQPRWWTRLVPTVLVGAAAGALLVGWLVIHVIAGLPMPRPAAIAWIGALLAAVGLCGAVLVGRPSTGRRVVAVVAALVIAVTALDGIDRVYAYQPTLATAFGVVPRGAAALPDPQSSADPPVTVGASDPAVPTTAIPTGPDAAATGSGARPPATLADWRAQGHLPATGSLSQVAIPGTVSGFAARPGWVYLPPAYSARNRPDLPVLILIPGDPGGPSDWVTYGHLERTMDAFATAHHGIAPIVVVPDLTGSHRGNTMCIDSTLGNADTYLTRDVVSWILRTLQVDRNFADWAIGGFSFGGTCALQMAVYHPRMFRTFLDISGDAAPTLGSSATTVREVFGGNLAAYRAVQPLQILIKDEANPAIAPLIRGLDGTFLVGSQDVLYARQQAAAVRGCRRAGMTVHALTYPGTHHWVDMQPTFAKVWQGMASRMGLP